jgi:hypothetical protein
MPGFPVVPLQSTKPKNGTMRFLTNETDGLNSFEVRHEIESKSLMSFADTTRNGGRSDPKNDESESWEILFGDSNLPSEIPKNPSNLSSNDFESNGNVISPTDLSFWNQQFERTGIYAANATGLSWLRSSRSRTVWGCPASHRGTHAVWIL